MWDRLVENALFTRSGSAPISRSFDYLSDHDIWQLPQVDDTYAGSDTHILRYIRHRPGVCGGTGGIEDKSKSRGAAGGELCGVFAGVSGSRSPSWRSDACWPRNMFSIWRAPAPRATAHHRALTISIQRASGATTWTGATELFFALRASSDKTSGLPHNHPGCLFWNLAAELGSTPYMTATGLAMRAIRSIFYDVAGAGRSFELYRAIEQAENPQLARGDESGPARRHGQGQDYESR